MKLNAMIVKDRYGIRRMNKFLDTSGEGRIFSTLDANYWNGRSAIDDWDKDRTMLTSQNGT